VSQKKRNIPTAAVRAAAAQKSVPAAEIQGHSSPDSAGSPVEEATKSDASVASVADNIGQQKGSWRFFLASELQPCLVPPEHNRAAAS
jgi:hypothetical protein